MEAPEITKVKLYKDAGGEWRFTAYSSNGNAIVVASESYVNHLDALGVAKSLFPFAEVDDEVGE